MAPKNIPPSASTCTGWVYEEQMTLILGQHNSVYPRFCWEPVFRRAGSPGFREVRLSLVMGKHQSGLGKVGGPSLRATQLSLSWTLPRSPGELDLDKVVLPGIWGMGPLGTLEAGLADFC